MAFDLDSLKTTLTNTFKGMSNGDNQVFADGISNAVVTFVGTGQVTTADAGTISAGGFSGSGTGTLTVTASACAGIIKSACDKMKGSPYDDNYLAEQIGAGLKKMADDGEVNTSVSGAISSGGTASGLAKGTIACSSTDLIQALKDIASLMYQKKDEERFDGNAKYAEEMAKAIKAFWEAGVVSTSGQGALEGSSGTGSIA